MKTYITSDLHIGHANIIKFCPKTRPYRNVQEMDNSMRNDWNTLIQPEDLVYILGDVAFNNGARAAQYVQSLNGRKILIEGNHDYKNLRDTAFRACFEQVHKYHELRYNGEIIVMFHYPIAEWNRCHHGSIHFHGHCHGSSLEIHQWRAMDAGVDSTGRIAVTMDELITEALKKPSRGHH